MWLIKTLQGFQNSQRRAVKAAAKVNGDIETRLSQNNVPIGHSSSVWRSLRSPLTCLNRKAGTMPGVVVAAARFSFDGRVIWVIYLYFHISHKKA